MQLPSIQRAKKSILRYPNVSVVVSQYQLIISILTLKPADFNAMQSNPSSSFK